MSDVFGILCLLPYDALMFYAFFTVVSAWSWGRRREVPDAALGILGIAVPFAAWIFTQLNSWAGLLIAVSYGGLWFWASEREGVSEDAMRRMSLEEGAAAAARRAAAPDDGVARLMLAQALEKQGLWAQALAEFEEAHRISAHMISESALGDARERLRRAVAEKRPAPRQTSVRRFFMRRRDWALAVAAGLLALWSPPRAAGLLAALGFARWLTSAEETPTTRASF